MLVPKINTKHLIVYFLWIYDFGAHSVKYFYLILYFFTRQIIIIMLSTWGSSLYALLTFDCFSTSTNIWVYTKSYKHNYTDSLLKTTFKNILQTQIFTFNQNLQISVKTFSTISCFKKHKSFIITTFLMDLNVRKTITESKVFFQSIFPHLTPRLINVNICLHWK